MAGPAQGLDQGTGGEMNKTDIEWTDYTWNPVTGCKHGCPYCYARDIAHRFYPKEIGFRPHFWKERLGEPARLKKPAKIFVCSMADLFGDWVPQEWIDQVLKVARECPQHTFQFLTKNPRRLLFINWPDNAWVGVTANNQPMFNEAAWRLSLTFKAKVRFISIEPFLSPVRMWKERYSLDWLIIGGQTGKRPLQPDPEWVGNLIADAGQRGIGVFTKDNLEGFHVRQWPKTWPCRKVAY
jgi:protein gp37